MKGLFGRGIRRLLLRVPEGPSTLLFVERGILLFPWCRRACERGALARQPSARLRVAPELSGVSCVSSFLPKGPGRRVGAASGHGLVAVGPGQSGGQAFREPEA